MNCLNCGQPHHGKFVLALGMFKVCLSCDTAGKELEQELKQGVHVESIDPKNGKVTHATYKIK